jgi:ankyrin repeat protein
MDNRNYNLHALAKQGDFTKLKAVLNTISIEEKASALNTLDEKKGWSPLHYAIENGHIDIVRLLLQHGTDPNLRARSDKPLIIFAISDMFKRPYALAGGVVHLLLDYNADPYYMYG